MSKTQTKTGNPFLDGDFGNITNFSKMAEQFKMPGVDSSALVESQRRNVETLTEINRVAFEGARAIMQRQAEILRQAAEEGAKAVRELSKPGKPEEKLAKQADLLKEIYEQNLANLRELAEMSAKANTQAAELLSHRFSTGLEEFKGAFKGANGAQ